MLVKTKNRKEALHAIINVWLKDPGIYCDWCGQAYNELFYPCCDSPNINTNLGHTKKLIQENKYIQQTRKNKFSSTSDKSFRWVVRIPPTLYHMLNNYCKSNGEKGLFNEKYNASWFGKKFRMFCIPEEV